MGKRARQIRHSLLLVLAALAGCGGGEEERSEVAYAVVRQDVPTRVVVVEDDGTDARRVSSSEHRASHVFPTWSPDGRRLAFVRFRPTRGAAGLEVYVVNADGSGERSVGKGTLPVWTHDSRSLLVQRPRTPPKSPTIHVVSVDGGGERRLAVGSAPVLAHRSSRVAFIRDVFGVSSSLYTISLDGTGLRRLARMKGQAIFRQPSWLPDESGVAVIERKAGLRQPLVTFSTTGARRVVAPTVGETYDWSPNGDLVAYTRDENLYVVRPDGTEVEAYGQSNAIDIEWSPDGKRIAYSVQETAETDVETVGLYLIDLDKDERRRFVITDGTIAYLDWRPEPPEEE
jgi:Tol biopolymer transport system component